MNNREVALEFIRCFYSGDVGGIAALLAEDLRFTGPFYRFDSAHAYLTSLRSAPPEKCGYRVLNVTEGEESVSIHYDYEKHDRTITIAQLFKFRDRKTSEMLLVFDGRPVDRKTDRHKKT